ncbi:phage portal protein, partial [Candidatus Parcubacteria bacterium]|nr:phage portal protein [Candidatus Parcubacteria bacterium]
MNESWLERAGDLVTGFFSAKALKIRKHHRLMERSGDYRAAFDTAARLRGYKSAASGKNATPFLGASNNSADAEILGDLTTLRNRSRLLNRDDAIATGITGTMTRGVVGTGLRPQACTNDDAKDDAMEAVWSSRADRLAQADGGMSHGEHQRLVYTKRNEDGGVFLRPALDETGSLWIETIEADRVRTPAGASPRDPAGRIVDGVEKDRFGRVVAYWILKKHPGDFPSGALTKVGQNEAKVSPYSVQSFDRVDAQFARHDRRGVTRPGQTHGVPLCHAILQDLRDLDLLILASLKKTQVSACLAVFLTSAAESTDLIELTAQDYGYQLDQRLEPGMIFRLFPGEKIEQTTPQAGAPELDRFVFLLARRIGAAVGLSPQAILRAWETLSYSAARTVKIDDRQTFRAERADFAGTLTWEWRVVLEMELLRGNPELLAAGVTMADLDSVEWIGDEEPWVDPLADAQAIELMLRLGLTTFQGECGKLGHDWQDNIRNLP